MKAFPLILIAILCLAFGWFAHYSLVPETTYVTDTLIIRDTISIFSVDVIDPSKDREVKGFYGWRNISTELDGPNIVVQLLEAENGDTLQYYRDRNYVFRFRNLTYPELPKDSEH